MRDARVSWMNQGKIEDGRRWGITYMDLENVNKKRPERKADTHHKLNRTVISRIAWLRQHCGKNGGHVWAWTLDGCGCRENGDAFDSSRHTGRLSDRLFVLSSLRLASQLLFPIHSPFSARFLDVWDNLFTNWLSALSLCWSFDAFPGRQMHHAGPTYHVFTSAERDSRKKTTLITLSTWGILTTTAA